MFDTSSPFTTTSTSWYPIKIVWSWHDPPTTESFQKTLSSIEEQSLLHHTTIHIYCGSNACVQRAQQAAINAISSNTRCVQIQTMVVPLLAQNTPLEEWGGENLLAKLLHAQHFEETLQVAMQLVIIVKYGGLSLLLGNTITDDFLLLLSSPREAIFSYHNASIVMPKAGLHAALAPSKHSVMLATYCRS